MSESEEVDVVNHPSHYKAENGIEAIDVIEGFNLDTSYALASACKYLLRCMHKGRMLEDLKKCRWFLNRAIANLEMEEAQRQNVSQS